MSKITSKIATPIVLVGIFAIVVFMAMNFEQLEPSFYIILFLLTVFVFFFGFSTGQTLASPIRKLLNRAIDLSKGDLKTRVYLETKDELADLAKVFNQIAERLEDSQLNEEKAGKSVDIKVRAKTQALEETISALEQKIKNRTIELQRVTEKLEKLQAEKQKG